MHDAMHLRFQSDIVGVGALCTGSFATLARNSPRLVFGENLAADRRPGSSSK